MVKITKSIAVVEYEVCVQLCISYLVWWHTSVFHLPRQAIFEAFIIVSRFSRGYSSIFIVRYSYTLLIAINFALVPDL